MKLKISIVLILFSTTILFSQKRNISLAFGLGMTPIPHKSDYQLNFGGLVESGEIKYFFNKKLCLGIIAEGARPNIEYAAFKTNLNGDTLKNVIGGSTRSKYLLFLDYYFLEKTKTINLYSRIGFGYVTVDPVNGTLDGINNNMYFGKSKSIGSMVGFGIEFKKHLTLQSEFNFFPEGDYYKYNENNMIVPYKLNQNYFVFKIAYRFNIHLK